MDANTILELEALKMEARAIEQYEGHMCAVDGWTVCKHEAFRDYATRIRALKTDPRKEAGHAECVLLSATGGE